MVWCLMKLCLCSYICQLINVACVYRNLSFMPSAMFQMTEAVMKKVEPGQAAVKRECCISGRGSLHAVGPAKSHQEITYVDVAVIGLLPSAVLRLLGVVYCLEH